MGGQYVATSGNATAAAGGLYVINFPIPQSEAPHAVIWDLVLSSSDPKYATCFALIEESTNAVLFAGSVRSWQEGNASFQWQKGLWTTQVGQRVRLETTTPGPIAVSTSWTMEMP